MNILDDITKIKSLDKSNLYGSVIELSQQCSHAWGETQGIDLPDSHRQVDKILITGMGGSGLGARIIESVYFDQLKYPLFRLNDYDLPGWVDGHTLVICSSFSGTTEETVTSAQQAQAKGLHWIAIGTGGALIELAKKHHAPFYQINPVYNPSKQPRMAIGYQIISQLVFTHKAGLIKFTETDVASITTDLADIVKANSLEVPAADNPAKKMAQDFYQKNVIFVAARHLVGAVHTAKNQMNENSKNFSTAFDIPELNHHLMEGLLHPDSNQQHLVFYFVNSELYPDRIQQRFAISQEVVAKNHIPVTAFKPNSKSKLSQALEVVQFGSFINFYLAVLYELDPAPIPWVDYFKSQLGQPLGQWK